MRTLWKNNEEGFPKTSALTSQAYWKKIVIGYSSEELLNIIDNEQITAPPEPSYKLQHQDSAHLSPYNIFYEDKHIFPFVDQFYIQPVCIRNIYHCITLAQGRRVMDYQAFLVS